MIAPPRLTPEQKAARQAGGGESTGVLAAGESTPAGHCVVCGRDVDAATIPLLANSPLYCSRGERRRRVTTAAGTVFGPRAGCPFKPSGGR